MISSRFFVRVMAFAAVLFTPAMFSVSSKAQNPMTGAPTPAPQPVAQAPSAAPATTPGAAPAAQPGSLCGNQPLCYESQDFVATVTDFRTSQAGYYKVLDATIRFQNKTNAPLALGYTNGSGAALDDRSVRYAVGGGNALRGMGFVNGQSADPKFVLSPGGFGDARFELLGSSQIYGLTYDLNLTVNEITLIEGNQHTVGAEFPIQFHALANGVRGTSPGVPAGGFAGVSNLMSSTGSQTCGAAGTLTNVASATNNAGVQNAANTASNGVSTATSAVNSLKSLFGRKPAATAAAQPTGAPCTPATPAASVPATVAPAAAAATNAVTSANPAATPATAAPAASTPATTTPATPPATAMKTPGVTPAKPATTVAKPAVAPKPAPKKAVPATPAQTAPAPASPQK